MIDSDAVVWAIIVGSIAVGFVWGRISSRLRIPELVRLLATPVLTGALAVVVGCVAFAIRARAHVEPRSGNGFGVYDLIRLTLGSIFVLFLVGAAFGFPAVLGWVIGYRRPETRVPRPE